MDHAICKVQDSCKGMANDWVLKALINCHLWHGSFDAQPQHQWIEYATLHALLPADHGSKVPPPD
jgi:hypothetical protein